ncbi:MAG: uracil-DNA glycosylase [Candidatus Nitrospinota bacterium M3_3B_026]
MSASRELLARLDALSLELETLKIMGCRELEGPLPADWIERLSADGGGDTVDKTVEKRKPAGARESLDAIRGEVKSCHKCGLSETRTNTVFGVGNPDARLMFIGEAPGADEDRKGEPFVGRAGQLLTRMIKAMGLKREDVYIANILKCRPPGNRDPLPGEVELCEPYLVRQIEAVRPEVICALGRVAVQTLLKTKTPISRLRGEFHSYHDTPLLATFHPAYLLRNPPSKAEAWSDLQMVMKKLGMPLPAKGENG